MTGCPQLGPFFSGTIYNPKSTKSSISQHQTIQLLELVVSQMFDDQPVSSSWNKIDGILFSPII